jgi:GDP-L-fucose synthase
MNDLTAKLFDLTDKRVFVAGHRGMVGSAIVWRLARERCTRQPRRNDYNVRVSSARKRIYANDTFPADFIYENLANVLTADRNKVDLLRQNATERSR